MSNIVKEMSDIVKDNNETFIGYHTSNELPKDPIEDLLSMYRKERIAEIDMEADENIQEIREKSKLGKIYKRLVKQADVEIKKEFSEIYEQIKDKIYISFDNTCEMQRDIDKIIELRTEQIEDLQDMIKKVRIMLALTETYEQKMDILKRYEILNEDGIF